MTLEEVQRLIDDEAGPDHGIHVVHVPAAGDEPYEWQLKLDDHVMKVRLERRITDLRQQAAECVRETWSVRSRRSHTPHVVACERDALLAAIRWLVADALGVASVHGVLWMTTAEIRQMAEARQAQRDNRHAAVDVFNGSRYPLPDNAVVQSGQLRLRRELVESLLSSHADEQAERRARSQQVTVAHWDVAGFRIIDDPVRPSGAADFERAMNAVRRLESVMRHQAVHLHRSAPAKAFSPDLIEGLLDSRTFDPMRHVEMAPVSLPSDAEVDALLDGAGPPAFSQQSVAKPDVDRAVRRATMECPAAHAVHALGGGVEGVIDALIDAYRDAMQRLERQAMAAPPLVLVVDDALRLQVAGDLTLRRLRAALGLGEGAAVEDEVEAIVRQRALVNEMVDWCSRHVPEPPWDSEVEEYGPELAHAVNASRWLRSLKGLLEDERRHGAKVQGQLKQARQDLTAAHVECANLGGEIAELLSPAVYERVAREDAARQRPRPAPLALHVPGDAPPLDAPTFAPGDDPTRHMVDDDE